MLKNVIIILLCWWISALPVYAEKITIAVAANFSLAMKELVADFESETGHQITVSYGSSGRLYAQLVNGAPYQLFFSADQEKPEALIKAGLADAGSQFTYATGSLVLWSADDALPVMEASALHHMQVNKLAMANPRLAPYGKAAIQVLQTLGLYTDYENRLVMGENINQAFQFVTIGNAEAGFVSLSQVILNGEIKSGAGWIVPAHSHDPIRQDVVMINGAQDNEAASDFLGFIQSNQAQAIISSYGYRTE